MLILFTDRVIVQFRAVRHNLQCVKTNFWWVVYSVIMLWCF